MACELDGNDCSVVINEDQIFQGGSVQGNFRSCGLALDPESRLLFWSNSLGYISSAGMDGTNPGPINTPYYNSMEGLAVDYDLKRIVWGNTQRNFITSCEFDGSDYRRSRYYTDSPYTVDVAKDTYFWSSPNSGQVCSSDKIRDNVCSSVYDRPSPVPYGINIQHPSKQRPMPNPCSNTDCIVTFAFCLRPPAASAAPVRPAWNSQVMEELARVFPVRCRSCL